MNYNLNPNRGLGYFDIGAPLSECVARLQRESQREIKLCFCEEAIFSLPIVVEQSELGIELTFQPASQRLQLIRIDVGQIGLTYGDKQLAEPGQPTSLKSISNLFGPSFPGSYDPETQLYTVEYCGACFQFNAGHSEVEDMDASLVPSLPEERQPLLTRVFVFHGESIRSCKIPDLRHLPQHYNPLEIDRIHADSEGILFIDRKKRVNFHAHVQHVLGVMGPPDKIFEHRADELTHGEMLAYCVFPYFYNYFRLGLAIMFDGKTHTVEKIFLNTNLPDRPDFGMWRKCNFVLSVKSPSAVVEVLPEMTYGEMEELLGPAAGPIINSSDQHSLRATKIYSYPNMLLEFTQVTKCLCRVILFPGSQPPLEASDREDDVADALVLVDHSPLLTSQAKQVAPPAFSLQSQNSSSSLIDWSGPFEINQD